MAVPEHKPAPIKADRFSEMPPPPAPCRPAGWKKAKPETSFGTNPAGGSLFWYLLAMVLFFVAIALIGWSLGYRLPDPNLYCNRQSVCITAVPDGR